MKDVLQVVMADRQGNSVDIDVLDNNDGSFTVKYTAPNAGAYQVKKLVLQQKAMNSKDHAKMSSLNVIVSHFLLF